MFSEEKITKEMIFKGLCNETIRIINNPNDDCIAAQIGSYWFYFTESENEDLSSEEYYETYTKEEITDMIYDVINDEPINGETEDDASEWLYYRACLLESEQKRR